DHRHRPSWSRCLYARENVGKPKNLTPLAELLLIFLAKPSHNPPGSDRARKNKDWGHYNCQNYSPGHKVCLVNNCINAKFSITPFAPTLPDLFHMNEEHSTV
ncbi:hypothetical protein, partial [Stenotrophomonas ginsengisoli]|uniref:hypothetical protein n=1 Tax=Stenotrophomonas ginsengisoli TaxID=336566 RepID=UPI001B801BA6